MKNKNQEIARKTGILVAKLLESLFDPAIGSPWKKHFTDGRVIPITNADARELIKLFKDITTSEFNDIFEGFKKSILDTTTYKDKEYHLIVFTGLPGVIKSE